MKAEKKKFQESVHKLHVFLLELQEIASPMPAGLQGPKYSDALRNRAERLYDQILALPIVTQSCLAIDGKQGFKQPWPSKVKSAITALTQQPGTVISTALDSWAGTRMIMSKAQGVQHKSSADETSIITITAFGEKLGKMAKPDTESEPQVFFGHLKDFLKDMLSLTTALPSLSAVAFEETTDSLRVGVEKLVEYALWCDEFLWQRLCSDFAVDLTDGAPLKALCFDDKNVLTLPSDAIEALKGLQKAATFAVSAMPMWVANSTKFLDALSNFHTNVLKPLAKDTYDQTFATGAEEVARSVQVLATNAATRQKFASSVQALVRLCLSESRDKPFKDLLAEWQAWQGQAGHNSAAVAPAFVQDLLSLGSGRVCLAKFDTSDMNEQAVEHIKFITEGSLANAILKRHVRANVGETVEQFQNQVLSDSFGTTPAELWSANHEDDNKPRVDGLVELGEAAMTTIHATMKDLIAVEVNRAGDTQLGIETPIGKALAFVDTMVGVFSLTELCCSSLQGGQALPVEAALAHLRLQCFESEALQLVVYLHREVVDNTSTCFAQPTKKGDLAVGFEKHVMVAMDALAHKSEQMQALLSSATLKKASVLEISSTMPIVTMRNWALLADSYLKALRTFMLRSSLHVIDLQVAKLKSACPQWSAWVTDDKINLDELKQMLEKKVFDNADAKKLVCLIHNGLVALYEVAKLLKAGPLLKAPSVSPSISAAKAALQVGKDTMAVRACAVLLCTDDGKKPDFSKSTLANIAKIGTVPKVLIDAAKARASST